MKLITIFHNKVHKKCVKAIIFKISVCSITNRGALMCEVILVKVQFVTVKLLILFHNNNHKKYAKAIVFKMNVVVQPT